MANRIQYNNDPWFSCNERLSGNNPDFSDSETSGEINPELKGDGNSYTTEFRQYSLSRYRFSSDTFSSRRKIIVGNPRLGRWLSLDPLMAQFPWMSPYVAFDNNPVVFVDPLGLKSEGHWYGKDGKYIGDDKKDDKNTVYVIDQNKRGEKGDMSAEKLRERYDKDHAKIKLDEGKKTADLKVGEKLKINHTEFQKLSGLAAKEDFSTKEATMAIGSAQANRMKNNIENGKSFDQSFNSFNSGNAKKDDNGLHGYMLKNKPHYKEYWDKKPIDRNNFTRMVNGQASVINAWSEWGIDFVNGGIGWQGKDVNTKYKSDGKSIWPAYREWQMVKGFVWANNAIIGKGASMTPSTMPNVTIGNKKPAYIITASYGNTIFWKENK